MSNWLKCHYPAAFACALLNSQPMGFYAPAQIVGDAQAHGVEVRAVDVNDSGWDNSLEDEAGGNPALRLGLRQIGGLREVEAAQLVAAREAGEPFASVENLHRRAHLAVQTIERLAAADAFRSIGLDRRQALWDARALKRGSDLPLFAAAEAREEGAERARHILPVMPLPEHVVADYQTTRLSLKAHPLSFLREDFTARGFTPARRLRGLKFKQFVQVAGVVLIRQRPGSAKGVCFITLEDETGVANLVIWPDVMERYRRVVMGARLMEVKGRVEMDDEVIHVIAAHLEDATHRLSELSHDLLQPALSRADEVNRPLRTMSEVKGKIAVDCTQPPALGHPRNTRIFPNSRDFH